MRFILKISRITVLVTTFIMLFMAGCKKDEEATVSKETGTMTDVEGNVYKTIKIGNQWWMAEDLKVTKYRNGVSISEIPSTENELWSHDSAGAYCDIEITGGGVIGKYYNWYAIINSHTIAPDGWHIPSDGEWKQLEESVGMSSDEIEKTSWRGGHEGEKLKIEAPEGWRTYEDVWSTNESGFTALANGCRLFSGVPGDPGIKATGFWWSSTEHAGNQAWYRNLDYKKTNVFRSYCAKTYGFSIRCVKD